ncbi:MAG: GNAT family N-acetyltransferase [Acidobacteria bacterium]|nr:GNAT family N-acetyltransferase [Acidobacteriota bacterium]
MTIGVAIEEARDPAQIEDARRLFQDYADSLGFRLDFQNFEQELALLPGDYSPPSGCLLLAYVTDETERAAGCVALHRLEHDICEMKRLYVRPQYRGMGIGRMLANQVIEQARTMRYSRMRLDTVAAVMQQAVGLYRSLGFRDIEPYRTNPMQSTIYMELQLSPE